MQNEYPPDIQSPRSLGKRLQLLIVLACALLIAIAGIFVWYRQFRSLRIPFQVRNYVAPAKIIEPILTSHSSVININPPGSAFRQLELTDQETQQLLAPGNGAELIWNEYQSVITSPYVKGMTWHANHELATANLDGKFEAKLENGAEMLQITLDADLKKPDPNESRKEKAQRGGGSASSNLKRTVFRFDAIYNGTVPHGSLLFIKKIDDDSYQVIVFDPY